MTPLRHSRALALLAGLALAGSACDVDEDDPADGGQSGTAVPDGCYEDHRVPVTDLTTPADGFDRSAEEAIAELAGTWVGSGAVDGDPADVSIVVAHDGGAVDAVYFEYRGGGGGSEGMGAPATSAGTHTCAPRYAFGVTAALDLSPYVAGEGGGVVYQTMGGQSTFSAEIPREDVVGTSSPGFDTSAWDRTVLVASMTYAEDVSLDVAWWGLNDTETAAAATSTATATSTVTVEPSGTDEPIASFQGLVRQ